jgi:hypothetical protein
MPGNGLKAGVLLDELRARCSKRLLSSAVHQSRIMPLRVELAALVVEAVTDLVTDHGADAAVVDRIVRGRIEERRLQDRSREHDLVGKRVVVRVHRLRRHDPLGLVDGPVDLGEIAPHVDHARIHDVADQVVRLDREAGIFLPLVRIPDLHREVANFLLGGARVSGPIQSS